MNTEGMTLVMIPKEELEILLSTQRDILERLKELNNRGATTVQPKYITAIEFMRAVRIGRTKFDELVKMSKIKTIKKRRKIYVPVSEVQRFFEDGNIQ